MNRRRKSGFEEVPRHSAMRIALVCGLVGLLGALAGSRVGAEEKCGVCHPEERVIYETSDHAAEGVGCVDCHGGLAGSMDAKKAHTGRNYRALSDRAEIPQLCASCHADLDRMRPYNLPVDQYAIYLTSQHGKALAAGDLRTAVCTDCHGVHGILSPSDSGSSVYSRNVPETCGSCHADAALMAVYELDAGVVGDYVGSIHGAALLEEGNSAAPNCTNCHGVHGATPPGVGDLDKVCGACHQQIRAVFTSGPHHEGLRKAGRPECASCHSNHAIQRFDRTSIAPLCGSCHKPDSEEVALGAKISTLILNAQDVVDRAEELVVEGELHALDVEDQLGRLEEAGTHLRESGPMMHAVDLETVEEVTRRAKSIGEEVQNELHEKLDPSLARVGLTLFWFYLLMTLAVLFYYKRSLTGGGESS